MLTIQGMARSEVIFIIRSPAPREKAGDEREQHGEGAGDPIGIAHRFRLPNLPHATPNTASSSPVSTNSPGSGEPSAGRTLPVWGLRGVTLGVGWIVGPTGVVDPVGVVVSGLLLGTTTNTVPVATVAVAAIVAVGIGAKVGRGLGVLVTAWVVGVSGEGDRVALLVEVAKGDGWIVGRVGCGVPEWAQLAARTVISSAKMPAAMDAIFFHTYFSLSDGLL